MTMRCPCPRPRGSSPTLRTAPHTPADRRTHPSETQRQARHPTASTSSTEPAGGGRTPEHEHRDVGPKARPKAQAQHTAPRPTRARPTTLGTQGRRGRQALTGPAGQRLRDGGAPGYLAVRSGLRPLAVATAMETGPPGSMRIGGLPTALALGTYARSLSQTTLIRPDLWLCAVLIGRVGIFGTLTGLFCCCRSVGYLRRRNRQT